MYKKKGRKKRARQTPDDIDLTPMIDVVFQLLVYFVVTFEPLDIFTNLDVYRPSPQDTKEKAETPPEIIKVTIYKGGGFTINDFAVDYATLEQRMTRLAGMSKTQTIMIMCTASSQHKNLVQVLNLCAKVGLTNLSVVSTN